MYLLPLKMTFVKGCDLNRAALSKLSALSEAGRKGLLAMCSQPLTAQSITLMSRTAQKCSCFIFLSVEEI